MSLEISQNSQENNFVRVSFLIKLQASGLRTPFLKEHLRWLLLLSRHLRKELILGIDHSDLNDLRFFNLTFENFLSNEQSQQLKGQRHNLRYSKVCIDVLIILNKLHSKSAFTCSKTTMETPERLQCWQEIQHNSVIDIVLVSLLSTLNKFQTMFWCFYCWLWAS